MFPCVNKDVSHFSLIWASKGILSKAKGEQAKKEHPVNAGRDKVTLGGGRRGGGASSICLPAVFPRPRTAAGSRNCPLDKQMFPGHLAGF